MLHIDKILLPTDFSAQSDYALRLATSLARDHEAKLLILHVAATLGAEFVSFGEAVSQLQPETHLHQIREELERVRPPDPDVPVEHILAEGDPAQEILRVARETNCGLIVMGTHGRSGLQRLLMGSVAEQVMRHASCPLLTVKLPPSYS